MPPSGAPCAGRRVTDGLQVRATAKLAEVEAKLADLAVIRDTLRAALDAGCDPGWRTTWRGCDNSDWRTHRGLIEYQVHPRSALRERRAGLDPHAGDREDPVANAAV